MQANKVWRARGIENGELKKWDVDDVDGSVLSNEREWGGR